MSQQRIRELQQALLSGNGVAALPLAQSLAQTYPAAAEPVLYQALCHLQLGNPSKTLHILQPLLPHIAQQPHVFYAALYALLAANPSAEWPQALAPLNQPGMPLLLRFLALTQQLAGAHIADDPQTRSPLQTQLQEMIPHLANIPLAPRDELENRDLTRALTIANAYANLLLRLPAAPKAQPSLPTLWMLGDSHVLPAHGQTILFNNTPHRIKSLLAMGVKWHHLRHGTENLQKTALLTQLKHIPAAAPILISIGEIDTRPDEGIWPTARKNGQNAETLAQETFSAGLSWLRATRSSLLVLVGLPAPRPNQLENLSPAEKPAYLAFLKQADTILKNLAETNACGFLDIFSLTTADASWHLDGLHLKPEALPAAFVRHFHPPVI